MKYLLILLLLSSCTTTVPVKPKFPEAPKQLLEQCVPLKLVAKNSELSDFIKVVVENYQQYYICSENNSAWIQWYQAQQRIFNERQ